MVRRVEPSEIVELPYDERRIIVVTDRVPAAAAKRQSSRADVLTNFLPMVGGRLPWLVGGIVGGAAIQLIVEAAKEFRSAGEAIFPINWETAKGLRFPPGHPRRNVVYVGHPVDAGYYIPAADFHRFLFQHKVAEAQRLIRSLGAVDVRVVHVQGWDRSAAIKMGLSLPPAVSGAEVEVGAEADLTQKTGHQILMTMKLTPTDDPYMPNDLVWTPHEPLWQEVAAARLESGLEQFAIDVRSTDDFGVNAGLKLLIQKTGLDAGGNFVEHQDTVWQLEGTFS